jgi:four helix bundle protein
MSGLNGANDYKDLLVWQKGIRLVKKIYEVTQTFPADERFGLTSQMRRAAVSVPSNIAEGQARHTTGAFIQFLSNAEGSLAELDTQLTNAVELRYCTPSDHCDLSESTTALLRMLNALPRILTPHC